MREEQERYIETYRAMGTKKEKYCKRIRKMSKEENHSFTALIWILLLKTLKAILCLCDHRGN